MIKHNKKNKLHEAAALVESIALTKISNGNTVDEYLKVDGVSLFNIVKSSVANTMIVDYQECYSSTVRNTIIRALRNIKYDFLFLRSLSKFIFSKVIRKNNHKSNRKITALAFSKYIFDQNYSPMSHALELGEVEYVAKYIDPGLSADNTTIFILFRRIFKYKKRAKDVCRILREIQGNPELDRLIEFVMLRYIRNFIIYLGAARELVEKTDNVLISTDVNNPLDQMCVAYANRFNLETLQIAFAFTSNMNMEWMFCRTKKILTHSRKGVEEIKKLSKNGEVYLIPAYNYIDLINQHSVSKGDYALLISQPYFPEAFPCYETYVKMHRDIIKICSLNNISLIIKLHPFQSKSVFKHIGNGYKYEVANNVSHQQAINLVAKSKFVIGFFSTMLFDALLLKKRVCFVNYPPFYDDLLYREAGLSNYCNEYTELSNVIVCLSEDNKESVSELDINQKFIDDQIELNLEHDSFGLVHRYTI
jgi:hypothetical protein